MQGWTKYFANGVQIKEPASWSRTTTENMSGASLSFNQKTIIIHGHGSYWQSDTYETDVVLGQETQGSLIARRLEKYIDRPSYAFVQQEDEFGLVIDFRIPKTSPVTGRFLNLTKNIPFWLVLEINLNHNSPIYFASKERI